MLSEAMNFNHLPVHGGLYDQDPRLLDDWSLILQAKAREARNKQKKTEAQVKKARGS